MNPTEKLLLANKAWTLEKNIDDPDFFKNLSEIQRPKFLWIGCSDSRVPADQITRTQPGEIFVHRNIANLVIHNDVNLLSVLDYAVNYLAVKHVIVCGHYGCGGVKAAMTQNDYGDILNAWLKYIKDVYQENKKEIHSLHTPENQFDRLVELNIKAQVQHLSQTTIIQKAWKKHQYPTIHGWVYRLTDGLLSEITKMDFEYHQEPIFEYKIM